MINKKDRELGYTQFFIDRLNKKYAKNFEVKLNLLESNKDGDVDTYAYSPNGIELKLQLTNGQPDIPKTFAALRKKAKNSDGVAVESLHLSVPAMVTNALTRKNYPFDQKKELILLIEHEYGTLFDRDYVKQVFNKFVDTPYKGIYIIKLPTKLSTSSNPDGGQIVAIKNPFGENCDIF